MIIAGAINILIQYLNHKKILATAWHGTLHSPYRSGEQHPVLVLGPTELQWTGDPQTPMYELSDTKIYLRMVDGEVQLSLVLRDKAGKVLGSIRDNEGALHRGPVTDRNFNANTLEVKDEAGDIVLQVQINGNKALLAGQFYARSGQGLVFGPGLNKFRGRELRPIDPYFKYPNQEGQHAGELEGR